MSTSLDVQQPIAERARGFAPVVWLLGKVQSGKTSIIREPTQSSDAEIGSGFRACTKTARVFDFPSEAPIIRFLDTRGLGEVAYDTRAANLTEAWKRARAAGLLVDETLPPESWASSVQVRMTMRGNRSKNTTPEMKLRSLLHRRGLRYRVDAPPTPGTRRRADVVFPRERIAVFVDGCFWHGCSEHYRPSTRNIAFWEEKLETNRARDTQTNETLAAAGWTVIRVWEHEDMSEAADRIEVAVRSI